MKTSLNRLRGKSILDPRAASAEQLFLAPPFTEDVVAAIRLISTRLPLRADEASRLLWQRKVMPPRKRSTRRCCRCLAEVEKPKRVLEIGPGFGRSVVFFTKRGLAEQRDQSLRRERNQHQVQAEILRPPSPVAGYVRLSAGTFRSSRPCWITTASNQYKIFDAQQLPLAALPGPYDLIYGFYSIGFHWSLEYYLDDLEAIDAPAHACWFAR